MRAVGGIGGRTSFLLHNPDTAITSIRRARANRALVPLFLVSGATALIYEILWERQLHLVVGTSQTAIVTVLASFMAGLAIGGFAASRYADRVRNPLLAYALLEGCIGLYALFFPHIVEFVQPIYLWFWQAYSPSQVGFALFQFVLTGLAMLPPTLCMGATLPLLTRFAAPDRQRAGARVGQLYGANTCGAVIGVGLAGFFLLPTFGLDATTWITAGANLVLCLVAGTLGVLAGDMPSSDSDTPEEEEASAPSYLWTAAGIAMLAGVSSLIYEVAWFRLMVLNLGGSAYAFSTMLLAFLLGIGLGGWGGGRVTDRAAAKGGIPAVFRLVMIYQVLIGVLAYVAMYLYGELPFVFVWLYERIESAPALMWPMKLLLALTVMLPPALIMGATFPALVRIAVRSSRLGRPVGRLYGWNTTGAIVGSVGGGLFLLPWLHIQGTVPVAVSINFLAAGLACVGIAQSGIGLPPLGVRAAWAVVAAAFMAIPQLVKPPWDPLLMTAGMYKYVSDMDSGARSRAEVIAFAIEPYELLFYDEGLSTVVTVR